MKTVVISYALDGDPVQHVHHSDAWSLFGMLTKAPLDLRVIMERRKSDDDSYAIETADLFVGMVHFRGCDLMEDVSRRIAVKKPLRLFFRREEPWHIELVLMLEHARLELARDTDMSVASWVFPTLIRIDAAGSMFNQVEGFVMSEGRRLSPPSAPRPLATL